MERAPEPVTWRELRLTEKHAHPVAAHLPHLPTLAHPHRRAPHAHSAARPARSTMSLSARASAVVAAAMTLALLGGGAAQLYSARLERAEQQATVAGFLHDFAVGARSQQADGSRLELQAVAYSSAKRSEALVVAGVAVAHAKTVANHVSHDVTPETLAPLEAARSRLAALIEAAPIPVPVPVPVQVPVAPAPRKTTVPAAAATRPPPDQLLVAGPGPTTLPTSEASTASGASVVSTGTAPRASARARSTRVVVAQDEAGSVPESEPAVVPAADAKPSNEPEPEPVPVLTALDLDVSAQMVIAAHLVTALSADVQATAAANIAAKKAAEAAAAAAKAAAEAAAQAAADARAAADRAAAIELARKVAVAVDSTNGAIPPDGLCGVSFSSEALMRCDAAAAIERLNTEYRADVGRDLDILSSYRSFADQVSVKASRGGLAATPGSSNHGLGLALDLGGFGSVGQFSAPDYLWMKLHATDFGWHHPLIMEPGGAGPPEPWHWEFDTNP